MFGGKSPPILYVFDDAKIGQEIERGKKYGEKIKIEWKKIYLCINNNQNRIKLWKLSS